MTGGFCALLGIFILTLPIPIVVNSFASYYKNRLWRNEVAIKKKQRIEEQRERKKRLQEQLRQQRGEGVATIEGIELEEPASSSSGPQVRSLCAIL